MASESALKFLPKADKTYANFEEFVKEEGFVYDATEGWTQGEKKDPMYFDSKTHLFTKLPNADSTFALSVKEKSNFNRLKQNFLASANTTIEEIEAARAAVHKGYATLKSCKQTTLDDPVLVKTAQFVKDNLLAMYKQAILDLEFGCEELVQLTYVVDPLCQHLVKAKPKTPQDEIDAIFFRMCFKIHLYWHQGLPVKLKAPMLKSLIAWGSQDRDFSGLIVEQALKLAEANSPSLI